MELRFSSARRNFLRNAGLVAAAGLAAVPARATEPGGTFLTASMRGSIDATDLGVRAGTVDDQSRAFEKMLAAAAQQNVPVHLPPGNYVVSNITLPRQVRLTGVPGASRIIYGGNGHLFAAEGSEHLEFSGIVLDGANRWLGDHVRGLLEMRSVTQLLIDNCEFVGSSKSGIVAERTSGRIERSAISGALDAGIYTIEAERMTITQNLIADCGDGGILVHRWQEGFDGTMVTGNRVERIGARSGGTGQNGNGINVFRAAGVMIANNRIADCAFSAIRSNSGSNVQIAGNQCNRSGETAIYSEFSFEGAVIANNIVDGAANGISIVNFNQGGRLAVCSGNLVRNLTTTGPYPADPPGFGLGISVEADTAVTGNVIEGAPLFGMLLGWGEYLRNVVANANVIRDCGTGIAVSAVKGAGSAVVSDNVISGARNGSIIGFEWSKPVTGDLAVSSRGHPSNVTVERNHVS